MCNLEQYSTQETGCIASILLQLTRQWSKSKIGAILGVIARWNSRSSADRKH